MLYILNIVRPLLKSDRLQYNGEMSTKPGPTILDVPSETIYAWEQEGFTKTNYACFHFQGPCDVEALDSALAQAQSAWPNFHANLIPTRFGLYRRLAWHVREQPAKLEVRDFTALENPPEDMEAWIHPQMLPEVDHLLDLQQEYPVKFILFLLPRQQCCLAMVVHHVVTDGGGVFDFMRDLFGIYHQMIKGSAPDWAQVSGMHSQAGAVTPVVPVSGWRFVRDLLAEWRKYPMWQAVRVASDPGGGHGRNMIRHIISDQDLQKALRERARREGGTLSDLVMAASKLAIQEFNGSRNAPSEIMYHGLAVNQRLRVAQSDAAILGNPMSVITIPSNSADRRDPETLLRYLVACRKRKLDAGHDLKISGLSRKLTMICRILPIGIRYQFLRLLVEQKLSYFLTNVGVVWPEMKDGRPTGQTAIKRVGDMELIDIHSSIGATKKTGNALILRTIYGKLYFIFALGKHLISEDDAQEFSSLVVKKTIGYL
ncbi:MAG: condensation domain-containing protein [Candidatus Alcyoniella australis]|nr:condensation domain-containing protein [Candidatus Alcyoniella australis]